MRLLIGGYGAAKGGAARGISAATIGADGRPSGVALAFAVESPSWLTVSGNRVWATLETSSEVLTLERVDDGFRETGRTGVGPEPCHLATVGHSLVAACYGDGSIWTLDPNHGDWLRGSRWRGAGHAHQSVAISDSRLASTDLGSDRVFLSDVGRRGARLRAAVTLPPGTEPRDIVALGDSRLAVLGEASGRILLLAPTGRGYAVAHAVTLPGAGPGAYAAGLAVSPTGHLLFAALRGPDTVVTLAVDPDGIRPVAVTPSGGSWPRHLLVHEGALHVANERSSNLASFAIDDAGGLTSLGDPVAVPSPTCLALFA